MARPWSGRLGAVSSVVVDTDVISYLYKAHSVGEQYLADLAEQTLILSFMTLAELDRWAIEANWGPAKRSKLRRFLESYILFPYDRGLCSKWAEVMVAAKKAGRRIDCADAGVAATALLTDSPLITHNRRDYLGVPGLTLISHGE